ncbi:Mutator family transposase [Cupriavidus necator]
MPVTNAIENINAQLRKIIKTRGHFPSNEAAIKLLWFVLRNITGKWGSSTYDWKALMNQFASIREERFIHPHR